MKKMFLENSELTLTKGFLSQKGVKNGFVTNADFEKAQERAHYVITFAAVAKGKKLVSDKVTTLDEIKAEVEKLLSKKDTCYFEKPVEVVGKITQQMKDEALAFVQYGEDLAKNCKLNKFMQDFNVIDEFESTGLFFEEGISPKLDKIYTVKEIKKAVESCVDLLA